MKNYCSLFFLLFICLGALKFNGKMKRHKFLFFFFFLNRHGINLCSQMAQWGMVNKKLNFLTICFFFFFFNFPQCFFKTFNQRLITVRDKWAYGEVNCWPKEFFQSASTWTWSRELLVKPKTVTLRPSAQPLGQPHH